MLSNQRQPVIALLVFGILWCLTVLGTVVITQMREQVATSPLQRTVEPRVFWGQGTATVNITYQERPDWVCPPDAQEANIFLLIDKSGSMAERQALAQAFLAAAQFISAIDSPVVQFGVIFFDSNPELVAPLSTDREAVQTSLVGQAGGGTDVGPALRMAGDLFDSAINKNSAQAVIILLSDGVSSNANLAQQIGDSLKNNDVHIITIGLGGADPIFLRRLASTHQDFHVAPTPQELEAIYTELAEAINTTVARDVVVLEQVHDRLVILPESIQPPGSITDQIIRWDLPSFSNEGFSVSYAVSAINLGLYSISKEETMMSYVDCVSGAVAANLTTGPQLLVLPSPAWAWLLLLPLVIPAVMLFWSKKPEPTSSVSPKPRQTSTTPLPVPDNKYPAWIKRLSEQMALTGSAASIDASDLSPTVIIGVGPVGREVLNQLAQILKSRYGGKTPEQVRLLQIDVQPKEKRGEKLTRPSYLEPIEWISLEPNLTEINRLLTREPDKRPHLRWYNPHVTTGRMQARMSIFYDLQSGTNNSLLWTSLERAAHKLAKPKLRLVGSTFDDTSGMLIDIARLMQIITQQDVDVELWLSGPMNEEWGTELLNDRRKLKPSDQQGRTLATLRELERFQANARTFFHYVSATNRQDQLHGETLFAVVQTLFLFSPEKKDTAVDRLAMITDCLLATLHTSVQQSFTQHLSGSQSIAGDLINKQGIGTVCSLAAHAVHAPLAQLEETLSWRALLDLLFEKEIGLFPFLELSSDGDYRSIKPDEAVLDNGAERQADAQKFLNAYQTRLSQPAFLQAVAHRLSQLLNGEVNDNVVVRQRAGGLLLAQRWLESLLPLVRREGNDGRNAALKLEQIVEALQKWQLFMEKELQPFVMTNWQTSRQQLQALLNQTGRRWTLSADLEWPVYRQRLRPTIAQTHQLHRAAQRFGWHVEYRQDTNEWLVNLFAPPGDFVWNDGGAYLEQYALPRQASEMSAKLYGLASPLVQNRAESEYALDEAESILVDVWLETVDVPCLDVGRFEAGEGLAYNDQIILVAPESGRSQRLRDRLHEKRQRQVLLCANNNHTSVILLNLLDRVPLSSYQGYGQEVWEQSYVDPQQYVWYGEQTAALMETSGERLGAKFVSWLERNEELLNLFAQGYIFGLLETSGQGEWNLPGLGSWRGEGLAGALENLFSSEIRHWPEPLQSSNSQHKERAIKQLKEAIAQREREIVENPDLGKRAYINQAETELVDPLLKSSNTRVQHFGHYLKGLIKTL